MRRIISHAPFTVEQDGIKVSCNETGKLTFARDISPDEEDKVEDIPASLIFKVANMLNATRKVRFEERK